MRLLIVEDEKSALEYLENGNYESVIQDVIPSGLE